MLCCIRKLMWILTATFVQLLLQVKYISSRDCVQRNIVVWFKQYLCTALPNFCCSNFWKTSNFIHRFRLYLPLTLILRMKWPDTFNFAGNIIDMCGWNGEVNYYIDCLHGMKLLIFFTVVCKVTWHGTMARFAYPAICCVSDMWSIDRFKFWFAGEWVCLDCQGSLTFYSKRQPCDLRYARDCQPFHLYKTIHCVDLACMIRIVVASKLNAM